MFARRATAALALTVLFLTGCPQNTVPADVSDAGPDLQEFLPDVQSDVQPDVPQDARPPESGIGNECVGGSGFAPEQGDCADGQLCLTDHHGFPNGYCVQNCDATDCPGDAVCVRLGGRYPVCLRACTSARDCRTADGYVCAPDGRGNRVCVPTDGPVGLRDGEACYTTSAGPYQLPALARRVFAGANLSVSSERSDSVSEAEGNVIASPLNSAVVSSYIAQSRGGVFMGTSVTPDGTSVVRTGSARDPERVATSDPVLAYTRDGRLLMVFLGYNFDSSGRPSGMRVRVAESTDDGRSWGTARAIEPDTFCTSGCDKPWIIAGPGPDDAGTESLYVGYMVQSSSNVRLVVQRSDDGGTNWTAPATIGTIEFVGGSQIVPNLLTFAVGGDGVLHVAYAGLRATGSSSVRFGDAGNRVVYRRSRDGGMTWSPPQRVSGVSDSPVYEQPIVDVDGETIHVAYVSGQSNGAWDVMLATSTDGGATWRQRKVNDEPDRCATHAFPWMVVDRRRHVVHLTWIENRFGDGAVVYANCPSDPSQPCSPNEQVSDAPFTFATSRDPSRWHGDYQGLTLSPGGDLWASWSDTRTGSPAMYMARGRLP